MRTSYAQFLLMIEFMEKYGDLSKLSGGPRGRQWSIKKWKELTVLLNSEGTGRSQNEEKWRKVWSDFKNNTKRKCAKINKSFKGTGGGPGLRVVLSDLETRVMAIMGEQAAVGMDVMEAGFSQDDSQPQDFRVATEELDLEGGSVHATSPIGDEDWNEPGGSRDPTCVPPEESTPLSPSSPLLVPPPPTQTRPPQNRQTRQNRRARRPISTAEAFLDADRNAREIERERDRMHFELEKERLRQRDTELQLQAQWIEFLNGALDVLREFLKGKDSNQRE